MYILIRQPEPENPSSVPWIRFQKSASTTLRTQHRRIVTIDRVVGIGWISHLGRKLFGSYWDKLGWDLKFGTEIMDYAKQKLLCGSIVLEAQNQPGSLACLSIRFPGI